MILPEKVNPEPNLKARTSLSNLSEYVANLASHINTLIFFSMLMLIFFQVLARYIFKYPMPWSEELIRYMFIITSFLGSAVAVQKSAHVEIDFWPTVLGKIKNQDVRLKIDRIILIAADVICLAFLTLFCWLVWEFVQKQIASGHESPVLRIPLSLVTGSILISSILMLFHYAVRLAEKINPKKW